MRDGQAVANSSWRAITARELFFYLLFVGPSTREQLCLAFWPDSSASRVRSNFHTTLYHMRKAVGAETVSYQDGLYAINPVIDLWCDAFEFEDLMAHARLWSAHDIRSEDRLRKATSMYRGDFLVAFDADWVLAYREKLQELYLEGLVALGESLRTRNEFAGSIDIFKRALTIDPYREDVHRALMSCYARKGERQKIITHAHELQTLFRRDLKTEPSQETLTLVSQLLS